MAKSGTTEQEPGAQPTSGPRLLWRFFERFLVHRRTLVAGFACIPLAHLCDVLVTLAIADALDRIEQGSEEFELSGACWLILAYGLGRALVRLAQRWWLVGVSRRVEVDLKDELFRKLTSLSFAFHTRSKSGDVISRLTSDVENVRMFLGPGIMYSTGTVVIVPVALVILVQTDALLGSVMLLPLVLMVVIMKALSGRIHRHSKAAQESLAKLSESAQESFAGIRVIKSYAREDDTIAAFDRVSRDSRDRHIELAGARGLNHAAIRGANGLAFVCILALGGLAMVDGRLSSGDLFRFIDLTQKVFWPIIALGWISGVYPRAVASARRIDDLLSSDDFIREREDAAIAHPGELALRNVTYTYPGATSPALRNVSLKVPAGSMLGVVGPTGSGKTTLLSLVGRFFDSTGDVRLNGVPLKDLELSSLRRSIGYVPQDGFLFSDTYRANVAFGSDEALDDDEIGAFVELAEMADEVANFPDGFDELIGERGMTLSGGQRQRTCIARALAARPSILILDDSLSSVDRETEAHLVERLLRKGARDTAGERTLLVAAHRLSTVQHADQIVVLRDDGSVEAIGRHAELAERPGWYRETLARQRTIDELEEL